MKPQSSDNKPARPGSATTRPWWGRRRWIAVGVIVLAAAGWAIWIYLNHVAEPVADRAQYEALSRKLTAIRNEITPIALAFTSQGATTPIDVSAYRTRIAAARTMVSSVNDVQVTSPDALEIRDLILTGGAEVVQGMDDAITALTQDSTSGADAASVTVEEGLTILDDARSRLDTVLGTSSTT